MTTTIDTRAAGMSAPTAASPYRLNFVRLVRSEALKLFTLRSTWWSLGVTVALATGISLLVAAVTNSLPEEIRAQMSVNPMSAVL